MSRSMLAAAARADNKRFFCCERDFKIVSPASSVSVAILCACSNVSERRSALETDVTSASRRSSSFKTAKEFLPEPPVVVVVAVPYSMSRLESNCCLKEYTAGRVSQRCTKTSAKDDDDDEGEEEHRTRAPKMPPQSERERERRKENHPRGEEQKFHSAGSLSPRRKVRRKKTNPRARLHAQRYNNNSANNKKKKKKSNDEKEGKTHRRALARRGWHLHHMLFSFVFLC